MESAIIKLRHVRPFGISGFEAILVIGLGLLIANSLVQWIQYLLIVILLGILIHWSLGINTAVNWLLGFLLILWINKKRLCSESRFFNRRV